MSTIESMIDGLCLLDPTDRTSLLGFESWIQAATAATAAAISPSGNDGGRHGERGGRERMENKEEERSKRASSSSWRPSNCILEKKFGSNLEFFLEHPIIASCSCQDPSPDRKSHDRV